jgi:UDP-glucose 4-epimerase
VAKCLVLGGDGFIGYHLVMALLREGHEVRSFDRLKGGAPVNLPAKQAGLELMAGDFLSVSDLDEALAGREYVFHLVSTTNPAVSVTDPMVDIETNLRMSVELLKLCVKHKVKRVIFPSTGGSIYGYALDRPLTERDPTEPITPYAVCKLAIEGYLRFFKQSHDLDYLALRISNPYGPRQNVAGSQGVIPIFMDRLRQDLPVTMYGDGSMVRDYIYVGDLADALVGAFQRPAKFTVYNVGSGEGLSLSDLLKRIEAATGRAAKVERQPHRASDVKKALLDVSRFEAEFGKLAKTDLDTALAATWKYVHERKDSA